nr:MAG TPA: hypothetical protein [Caudoviricetes sp.]
MPDYTKHLRLIKPGGNDYYNIDDFNQNAELIDKETEKLNNAVTEIKNGATREKAGIVQYGTTEGKALEGMMLARMFGCVGYGGDIQETGVKDVNYIYYDRNTRKMYKCLNQNSDVSANVANFIPLDNNSLLDRLENLIKVEIIQMTNLLDYIAGLNITEWYAPLPSHIDVNKVISVTNVNQGNWGEYCNLDIKAKTLRVGAFGNGKNYPLNQLQVIVAYLA